MNIVYIDDESRHRQLAMNAAEALQERLKEPVTFVFITKLAESGDAPLCLNDEGSEIAFETTGWPRDQFPSKPEIERFIAEPESLFLLDVRWRHSTVYGVSLARYLVKRGIPANRILLLSAYKEEALAKAGQWSNAPWCDAYDKADFESADPQAAERLADRLEALVRRAIKGMAEAEARRLMETLCGQGMAVGKNKTWQDAVVLALQAADTEATVLLRGETGTGKEEIATLVHQYSSRKSGAFVRLNCSAVPEHLLESELFGHEKGAFTGAVAQRKGRFEVASGGTILLDEIGDMGVHLQAKILRVLQEGQIERVGSSTPIRVDVRVIAATHQPLEEMMTAKQFREDLFHRLNVLSIKLPPLRERRDDIPLLAQHFLSKRCKTPQNQHNFSREAFQELMRPDYLWPGNVRQLKNLVERLVTMFPKVSVFSPTDIRAALETPDSHPEPRDRKAAAPASKSTWPGYREGILTRTDKHNFRDALARVTQDASIGDSAAREFLAGLLNAVVEQAKTKAASLKRDRAAIDTLFLVKELKTNNLIPAWLDVSGIQEDAWRHLCSVRKDNIVSRWEQRGIGRHTLKDGEKSMMDVFRQAVSQGGPQ